MPVKLLHNNGRNGAKWDDDELAIALQGYLNILGKRLKGEHYLVDEFIAALHREAMPWRTERSIQLRMQNISSVLYGLKYPIILEWQPAHNVGSGVRERIISLLDNSNIKALEAYAKTFSRELLDQRTSLLRKKESLNVPDGTLAPEWENKSIKSFYRDPTVRAWTLKNSNGICEGCQNPAAFIGTDGLPYLEVHHVVPLSIGGSDRVTNTVALCSNCHMRCHFSIDRDEFKLHLYQTIKRLNIEVPDVPLSKNS